MASGTSLSSILGISYSSGPRADLDRSALAFLARVDIYSMLAGLPIVVYMSYTGAS